MHPQIQLVREYCRAHSTRHCESAVSTARKSQQGSWESAKKGGKKERNASLARDSDVHDEDAKEVTKLDE